jgi:hypothetical protein
MNARQLARYFQAAKKDRKSNFREPFPLLTGRTVLCESESEYRLWESFTEGLETKQIDMNRISIRDLFEEFIPGGREIADSWNPRHGGGGINLLEDAGANTSDQFSNITGQIVYNRILQGFAAEAYVFSKIIPNVPTQFNGEKIAGISRIGDDAQVVQEGRDYPQVGVSEDYIQTPATVKRGMIDALTKEAVFFDRTGLLLQRCGEVGEFLGLNKEKRLIDAVCDVGAGAVTGGHRYNWKGTTYASFQTSTPWVNKQTGNALVDWTNIDKVEQVMNNITDPWTGEPIMIQPKDLIVTRGNLYTARRIVNATTVQVITPGFATSANPSRTESKNPIQDYRIISSALLKARVNTSTDWFIGDVERAVNYMENFPLTVVQAPANSDAEFKRDIVMQWKANERGAAAVVEPRLLVWSTVA